MKSKLVLALSTLLISMHAWGVDTTPPTLNIVHTWMEKEGSKTHFKMILDPSDETGLPGYPGMAIQFRSKLNSTAALPENTPWNDYPWIRGQAFDIPFSCSSVVFELRAVDAAGNFSPLQRRTFKSPFPYSNAPNENPKFGGAIPFTGNAIDCRGLFATTFDNTGYGDDLMQVDRTTGVITVRRQGVGGSFVTNTLELTPNSINDSAVADFNGDGRPDLAVVVDDTLKVFINDGVVNENLQFTETAVTGLATTGISTVLYCAVGNVTEGDKPDIVISGTGDDGMGGSVAKIAVLINNDTFQFGASNYAVAFTNTGAGRIGIGDVSGDGWADVVMADTDNNELVLFLNKANGSFYGADEATDSLQPQKVSTGFALGGLPAESLAVGDVTGDGRADAVITMHTFGATGSDGPNETRNQELWQLFEGRGAVSMHAKGLYLVGPKGPVTESASTFKSHVILQDLTGDRFPEMVFTSQFEAGAVGQPSGGIRAVRLIPQLNSQNFMTSFSFTEAAFATQTANPHRLASGRFSANSKRDILVANGSDPQLQWVFNNYTTLSKPLDAAVGVTTDSDPTGTPGNNGTPSFFEFLDGSVSYSLTFVNNTPSDITGAFADCTLPTNYSLHTELTDEGWSTPTVSGTRNIRWEVDIPAGSSIVKHFTATLYSGKVGTNIVATANLRQGTKSLISATAPVVKIAPIDLTVVPNSEGQPWTFTYRPLSVPGNGLATVHTSPNGVDWTYLNTGLGVMTQQVDAKPGSIPYFTFSSAVPPGTRYIRALLYSFTEGYKYSSVFSNFLPETSLTKVTSKSPPKSGQPWTFIANQASTAPNLTVRFQSSLTPYDEGSWSDLPIYSETVRKGAVWTSNTFNVPAGSRYFRAVAAAPGWRDSISGLIGPVPVASSAMILPPFSHFHIDFVDPARNGKFADFQATVPTVGGSKVRFQSKLLSEGEDKWADLFNGTMSVSGTKWSFKTYDMPVGIRQWRAVSSANGYYDSFSAVYDFEVLPPPIPQIGTWFADFESPVKGSTVKSSTFLVSLPILDFNGIQRVYLEYATTTSLTYKPLPNSDMAFSALTQTYTKNITMTGSGLVLIRAVVIDGYDPSQTSYSPGVLFTLAMGNGTSGPYLVGSPTTTFTQSTLKALGSVKIKARIGDDKQVKKVYLQRVTEAGEYSSTVGEMIRSGNTNPADYTITHSNLADGTYYYRIVAHDYDEVGNQELISARIGPFIVTTPQPPPPPANIDVAVSSRFVGPTVPAGKYNHAYMPYPDQGTVTFSYSGLRAGTTLFHAYRMRNGNGAESTLDRTQAYHTVKTTKTSGTFTIPAPFWINDDKNPYDGEGSYRIVASQNGTELPMGNGVPEFTVGHAWNLPNTFTTLDYGLYWFKDGKNALRCREDQNDEYFDRSKPTVIYVHGWQPGEVSVKRREGWMREDLYKKGTVYDMAKIWKDQGYNVGLFNWNQFGNSGGPDGLIYSQTNIYGGKVLLQWDALPAGHSMIYALYGGLDSKKKPITNLLYDEPGSGTPIMGKSVCDLFFDELEKCMSGYVPDAIHGREFRVIGHSLGTQVVGETMYNVLHDPGRGVPVPDRIALLEVAQMNVGTLLPPPNEDLNINQIQVANIQELIEDGVALESYQSTDLASLLGAALSKVGNLHDMTAYARVRPDHINPILGVAGSHNDIPRWYMNSLAVPEMDAWTYFVQLPLPVGRFQYFGKAISARTPIEHIRYWAGRRWWFEQSEGKNTLGVGDDVFEVWDNRNQP